MLSIGLLDALRMWKPEMPVSSTEGEQLMTDEVEAVAQRILDRAADQIGAHFANCHEYHLPCFAAFALRERREAATVAPAVDREALARLLDESDPEGGCLPDEGEPPYSYWYPQVDALLASGLLRDVRDVQAEALEQAADAEADWTASAWRSEEAETVAKLRKGLRARAQAIRGARSER